MNEIRYTLCSEFKDDVPEAFTARSRLTADESTKPTETDLDEGRLGSVHGETSFHPNLGWSHYRALMRVENPAARRFYEDEAANAGWSVREVRREMAALGFDDSPVAAAAATSSKKPKMPRAKSPRSKRK